MESKVKGPGSVAPPALAASAAAISMVLGDYDLLREFFLRLPFPDSLVRAAAVCRLWLRVASDPAFLRRFRDLHPPPGLLGFYLTTHSHTGKGFGVEFVPMQPQPPEIDALLRRARFGLDAYNSQSARVLDCRAGRVVTSLYRDGDFTHGVHTPLNPARGLDVFPRLPMTDAMAGRCWIFQEMLSKESADGVSYIWFTLEYSEGTATGSVYEIQDCAWRMCFSASTQIADPTLEAEGTKLSTMSIFLADDKIYMGITRDNILVLDLTSSTFSKINYHYEMALDQEVRLAPSNGSGFYLVNVNHLEVCIWLHRLGNGGAGDWMLLHTIYLRDMRSNLKLPSYDPVVYIHEVWQNAEFVLLEILGYVLYLDVKSKALQKVYRVTNETVCWIHPFMMTWPPIFPVLKE